MPTETPSSSQPSGALPHNKKSEYQIGMWGTVGSGKSLYLYMLRRDAERRQGRGLRITIPRGAKETQKHQDRVYAEIQQYGQPQATPVDPNECKVLKFQIFRDVGSLFWHILKLARLHVKSLSFQVMDAGGEWYLHPRKMREDHREEFHTLGQDDPITMLTKCDGIVFLLDAEIALEPHPETPEENDTRLTPEKLHHALSELFDILREESDTLKSEGDDDTGFIRQAVAFCVSKIDLTHASGYQDRPEDWVKQYFPAVYNLVLSNCHMTRRGWYGVSSVGVVQDDHGQYHSALEDGRIDFESCAPHNLSSPICWLAATVTGDNSWLVK